MRTPEAPPGLVDILIADDEAPVRALVRRLLEREGYACAEAADGRQAVELAQRRPPRCVLLDLGMPELDGFAVARRLRADPRTRAAHIHCLSGSGEPASREQASRAGCEEFLAKPLDAAALLRVVRRDVDRAEPRWVSGLTKAEAEDLLDWLEANGYAPAELSLREDGFAVRCPGLRESPP